MSVDNVMSKVNSAQFSEWKAYARIEPFGEERADLRAGIIAATIANVMSAKGKNYTAGDFMPDFVGATRGKQSVADMQRRVMLAAGGIIKNGKVS